MLLRLPQIRNLPLHAPLQLSTIIATRIDFILKNINLNTNQKGIQIGPVYLRIKKCL